MEGEFNRDEWFDIARQLKPELTREEFDLDWQEFQKAKQARLDGFKVN